MRYFLKLAKVNAENKPLNTGVFEEVDEFTFKNAKFALSDDGKSPRYTKDVVTVNEDSLTVKLDTVPLRDLAILSRYFQAMALPESTMKVDGGFVREQPPIRFNIRGKIKLREKDGSIWSQEKTKKEAA
jgi:hypothetical protein